MQHISRQSQGIPQLQASAYHLKLSAENSEARSLRLLHFLRLTRVVRMIKTNLDILIGLFAFMLPEGYSVCVCVCRVWAKIKVTLPAQTSRIDAKPNHSWNTNTTTSSDTLVAAAAFVGSLNSIMPRNSHRPQQSQACQCPLPCNTHTLAPVSL